MFLLLVLFFHENALSRFHGRQGCAVKRRVDPLDYDPSIWVIGGLPAVSWNKADHAYGSMLAVGLVVEVDVVLAIHACCSSGKLGIRGATNTRAAVNILQVAQVAFLPFAVLEDNVLEDVVVVDIDQVLTFIINLKCLQKRNNLIPESSQGTPLLKA